MVPAALDRRQLVVVTGKGGVGKTLTTAVIGHVLAHAGRRTLLVECDPRENLHQLLGIAPSGGDVVNVSPFLLLQNLQPGGVIEAVVRDQLKVDVLVQRVTRSPVFRHFVDAAPGLSEVAILGHTYRVIEGQTRLDGRIDTVVIDAPATGHAVALLRAPGVVADVIDDGPFADMAARLTDFISDPSRTSVVAVTTAEEMPLQETLELRAAIVGILGRGPDLLVVNGIHPPVDVAAPGDPLVELWRRRRATNEKQIERLGRSWPEARLELPLMALDRGPALVDALARHFTAARAAGGVATR